MARRVFYSFYFNNDCWRTSQVRNIGVIEGNRPAPDNDWESIKKKGDTAIKDWINNQMSGRSCVVVLVGSETATRKWVKYEIKKAWNDGRGVLGIRIHNLKDSDGKQSSQGSNPFSKFVIDNGIVRQNNGSLSDIFERQLSNYVELKNPPYFDSKQVYKYISDNISKWVEDAIAKRNNYQP